VCLAGWRIACHPASWRAKRQEPGAALLEAVHEHLAGKGLMVGTGTIVDATSQRVISPTSTERERRTRMLIGNKTTRARHAAP
jgi:hypothetical protein